MLKIFLPLLTANGRGEGRAHVRALRNVLVGLTKNTKIIDMPNTFVVKKTLNNFTLWMCATTETAETQHIEHRYFFISFMCFDRRKSYCTLSLV